VGSGTVSGGNVIDVVADCSDLPSDSYLVGGTVSGLEGTLVLQNNGGDDLIITENGGFTFSSPLPDGAEYCVTVLSSPPDEGTNIIFGKGKWTISCKYEIVTTIILKNY